MTAYIENIVLLLRAYIHFIFRGRANSVPKELKRVLVVQNAKMGDMVCVTPIFRALKKKFPTTKVVVMGNKINKDVLAGNRDVDEYIIAPQDERELHTILKKADVDAVFLTTQDSLTLPVSFLADIPLIVAPLVVNTKAETETITYKLLSYLVTTVTYTAEQYFPREFLRVLEPIGIVTDDTKKYLAYNDAAKKKIETFFAEAGIDPKNDFIVGISPSAGNKVKSWLPNRYAELIAYLKAKYRAKIIVVGAPPDKDIIAEMFSHVSDMTDIIDTSSRFSVEELKALVAHLSLFISGDTGPIHIADAFDVPTVNILGPVGEDEMPPRGEFHRNVVPPRKRAELFIMTVRQFNPVEAQKQINDTTVEMVESVVDRLIADVRASKLNV